MTEFEEKSYTVNYIKITITTFSYLLLLYEIESSTKNPLVNGIIKLHHILSATLTLLNDTGDHWKNLYKVKAVKNLNPLETNLLITMVL